ncbi:MAG: hypothetical protein NVSMB57_04360 [Actinomycetota bacterium]
MTDCAPVPGAAVIVLLTVTLQRTVPPPPLPEPSHCVTVVVQFDASLVVHAPPPMHTVCVEVAGSPVMVFVMVTLQLTV